MAARTDNTVLINAPLDLTWEMTNDVEAWPSLFTEYSTVQIIEQRGDTVRFRLTMHPDEDGKVWSWVSERTPDPGTHTVKARRLETGPFEYMNITWIYAPAGEGRTELRWIQDFAMKADAPADDAQAAAYLNRRTQREMARIKQVVEARSAAQAGCTPSAASPSGDLNGVSAVPEENVFRVLLRMRAATGREDDFESTWLKVGAMVAGQPGNLAQWLMQSQDEPGVFYIISDWANEARFRDFEHSAGHASNRRTLQGVRADVSMTTMYVLRFLPGAAQPAVSAVPAHAAARPGDGRR